MNSTLGLVRSCNHGSWCSSCLPSKGSSAFNRAFARTSEESPTRRSNWFDCELNTGVANAGRSALPLRGMVGVGTSVWFEAIMGIRAIFFGVIFEKPSLSEFTYEFEVNNFENDTF